MRPGGAGALTPLRVLSVISSSKVGGAEQVLATTLRIIDRTRVEMSVVCPADGPMVETYRRHAAAIWTMDLGHAFDPRAVVRLARIMADARVEVAHTRLWNADVLGGLAARRARIPVLVASVHGGYHQPTGVTGLRRLRRALLSHGYRAIYRCFDCVHVGGSYTRDDLVTRPGIRVDPRIIQLIPERTGPRSRRSPPRRRARAGATAPRRATHHHGGEPRSHEGSRMGPAGHAAGAGRLSRRPLCLRGGWAAPSASRAPRGPPRSGGAGDVRGRDRGSAAARPGERCLRAAVDRVGGRVDRAPRGPGARHAGRGLPRRRHSAGARRRARGAARPSGRARRAGGRDPPRARGPGARQRLSSAGQEYVRSRFSARASTECLAALYWDLAVRKGIREPASA